MTDATETHMRNDADLPGDSSFTALPPIVNTVVDTPNGPAWAQAMTISATAQAALHHNLLRYDELNAARAGRPNLYSATQYR
jgi:hypothetical protein